MKPTKVALLGATSLCAILFTSCSALAQEAIHDPLLKWMNQIAQRQLQARQRAIDQIHTVADADRRKTRFERSSWNFWAVCPITTGR